MSDDRQRLPDMVQFTQFAVENLVDAAYWVQPDATIIYVNDAACRMTGFSKEELLALHIYDLNPDITKDTWPAVWERLRSAKRRTFETRHQTKSGRIFPVEIAANLLEFRGREYSCAFARDISERKELELRLRQSEKMEAVGQLAGGVAHDFNNQLTGIRGYAELLGDAVAEQPRLRQLIDELIRIVERSADLTAQLLAFARKGTVRSEPVDFHRVVQNVVGMLDRSIDKRITIEMQLHAPAATVLGDASQLESAVLNLALNARDAMPQGGQLTFSTEQVHLDDEYPLDEPFKVAAGDYLRLIVADTGFGMSEDVRRRIFEPFFTTKETGKGTGLGMAGVYGAVQCHQGAIQIDSEPGGGTRAHLYLPISSGVSTNLSAERVELRRHEASRRVLVVDDEDAVRKVMVQSLERLGYVVTACKNGAECIDLYRVLPGAFDIVILDMVMPMLDGPETFDGLRELDPEVKVLLVSGFSGDGAADDLLRRGASGFIRKPFARAELAEKIAEILAGTTPTGTTPDRR